MNVKGLRIFVHIMEQGTLAKASSKIHLSQPAASRLLGLLEESLGGSLFHRQKSRLIPTAEGEKLYPEALRALRMLDSIPTTFQEIKQGTTRPLTIACLPRLVHSLATPAIAQLSQQNPNIRTKLEVMGRKDLQRGMEKNLFDIAISSIPTSSDLLDTDYLCETKLYVLVAIDSPLAKRDSLSAKDLSQHPYITLDRPSLIRQLIDTHQPTSQPLPEPSHLVSTIAAACHLIQEGSGFTIADPLALSKHWLDTVKAVPYTPSMSIEFGTFTNPTTSPHPALELFKTCLTSVSEKALANLQ